MSETSGAAEQRSRIVESLPMCARLVNRSGSRYALVPMDDRIQLLLVALDRAYSGRAWQGTTLRGALRGVKPDLALFRPAPDRKNIWELFLHTAYWKYIVRRAVTEDKSISFPRKPSNWPAVPPDPTLKALRADIALLDDQHRLLRESIASSKPSELTRTAGAAGRLDSLILGVAAHDTHHTGQIQLLKRLGR